MNADITLAAGAWHDIYAASGLSAGTALLIYNKGISSVLVWEGASHPGASSMDGIPVTPEEPIIVESGAPGCWVRSSSQVKINVQEYV